MEKFKFTIFAMLTLVIAGCSSKYGSKGGGLCDSDIAPMGPDTFIASAPCTGTHEFEHAAIFCSKQGKEVLVKNVLPDGRGQKVIFQCLRSNDQDLTRPEYERTPTVRIEDARSK